MNHHMPISNQESGEPSTSAKSYYRFGLMLSKSSKVQHQERALMYLEKSIELDRFSFSARYMYANLLSTHSHRRQEAIEQYQIILEHKPASVETLINLGAVYMKENALTKALECYAQALRYTDTSEGEYPEIYYNYGTILRRLERQEEAIEWVWNMLKRQLPQDDDALSMLDCTKPQAVVSCPASSDDTIILTIVCVKWGTKYSSEYVNKLYRGVRRNLSRDFRMVCLTENQDGLDPEIQCQELPSEQPFKGWWTKVHLFNPAMKLPRGKKVYIDLDTVIVGSLDTLVGLHPTTFGVLGTDTMKNEQRTGGYNSSMMIWQDQRHVKHVYDFLSRHYTVISKFIHKFDHWLEMTLPNASILQDCVPDQLFEYKYFCSIAPEERPITARVVTFPLTPKPHECEKVPFVKQHWI